MSPDLYAYMWATIAAGFAARTQALTPSQIAAKTNETIDEYNKLWVKKELDESTTPAPRA